jgi:hypothetical protein
MKVGSIYKIQLGKYSDSYLCTFSSPVGYDLRRVRMPKNKIDGVRLPEHISISHLGTPLYNLEKNK